MMEAILPVWLALPAALLLIVGGVTTLIGACGLLRFREFYARMHPPTMGMGLGAGCFLVASMLVSSVVHERLVIHEIAIAVFIVLTAPVSATTLIHAAMTRARRREASVNESAPPRE